MCLGMTHISCCPFCAVIFLSSVNFSWKWDNMQIWICILVAGIEWTRIDLCCAKLNWLAVGLIRSVITVWPFSGCWRFNGVILPVEGVHTSCKQWKVRIPLKSFTWWASRYSQGVQKSSPRYRHFCAAAHQGSDVAVHFTVVKPHLVGFLWSHHTILFSLKWSAAALDSCHHHPA